METRSVVVGDLPSESTVYQFRLLFSDVGEVTTEDERISCITSYEANVYLGTSKGQLLHYHHFEGAPGYLLIAKLQVAEVLVKKVVILPTIERALVLAGTIATVFTLPELSPCHIGKLKNINDILLMSFSSNHALVRSVPADNDKVITFTHNKIRILLISKETIKLIKDINYSGARKGISTASPMSSNYSNLVLVANDNNYDIIDIKHQRKIPLFEYNASMNADVVPHILPYKAHDKNDDEEYLISVKADDKSSMAMFINSLGDVTRGTLSWMEQGYPTGGVAIIWPYVFGIFELLEKKNTLVVSSLITFDVKTTIDLDDSVKPPEMEVNTTSVDEQDVVNKPISDESKDENEPRDQEEGTNDKDDAKDQEVEEESIPHKPTTSASTVDIPQEKRICYVDDIKLENKEISRLLSKYYLKSDTVTPYTRKQKDSGNLLIYDRTNVWLVLPQQRFIQLVNQSKHAVADPAPFISTIEKELDSFKGDQHDYLLHLLVLFLFHKKDVEVALRYLQRIKNGHLIINPLFVIHFLDGASIDVELYVGLKELIPSLQIDKDMEFLTSYFDHIFPDLTKDTETVNFIRLFYYNHFKTDEQVEKFFEKDKTNWLQYDEVNQSILDNLLEKNLIECQLSIVQELMQRDTESKEKLAAYYCSKAVTLIETTPSLIPIMLNQLNKNVIDENTYSKYLLEILKVDQKQSLEYMKKNKNVKFNRIHKKIMDELSTSVASVADFALLRIEYLESAFLENIDDTSLFDELIDEVVNVILSSAILTDEVVVNFEIIQNTFRIENSLQDSKWPKINWIDYLNIIKNRSECREFVGLYLKLYELVLLKQSKFNTTLGELLGKLDDNFKYFGLFTSPNPILALIEFGDYSGAELFATNGHLHYPKNPFYKIQPQYSKENSIEAIRARLHVILTFYIKQEAIEAIQHFVLTYGRTFYSPQEILEELPSSIPLAYLLDYLSATIIQLKSNNHHSLLRKAISKADNTFTTKLYDDLTKNG